MAAAQDADFQLVFDSAASVDFRDCRILCSSDSACAKAMDHGEKIKSQAGCVLGVLAKDGSSLPLLEFSTGTVKRVCRFTLAAESNGLVAATETADYLRSVILAASTNQVRHPRIRKTLRQQRSRPRTSPGESAEQAHRLHHHHA